MDIQAETISELRGRASDEPLRHSGSAEATVCAFLLIGLSLAVIQPAGAHDQAFNPQITRLDCRSDDSCCNWAEQGPFEKGFLSSGGEMEDVFQDGYAEDGFRGLAFNCRYDDAESLCWNVMERLGGSVSPDNHDVLTAKSILTEIYLKSGQFALAGYLADRVAAARFAEDSIQGLSMFATGASDGHKKIEIYLKQRLKLFESALGLEHPDSAEIMISLEDLYRSLGREAEADEVERAVKEYHPDLLLE